MSNQAAEPSGMREALIEIHRLATDGFAELHVDRIAVIAQRALASSPAPAADEDAMFQSAYGVPRSEGHPIVVEAWNRRAAFARDFDNKLPAVSDAARDMYSGD